jgi:uncharacterized repeat protein (TIGR04052 family)
MHTSLRRIALLSLVPWLFTACGPEDSGGQPLNVSITFKPMVGSQAFACGQTFTGLGTTATSYEPKDFRLYIHNVRLVSTQGMEVAVTLTDDGTWQKDGVALLDFENKTGLCSNGTDATNGRIVGTVPGGQYSGLRVTLGVPFEKNHQDASTASAPLNVSTLFWNWNGGYKFMRLDGRTTGQPNGYNLHLGSTGCQMAGPNQVTSCQQSNRVEAMLTDFELGKSQVVVDIAALFAGSNLDFNQAQSSPGCMSTPDDADCAPIFQRLGLAFGDTHAHPGQQSLFRVK